MKDGSPRVDEQCGRLGDVVELDRAPRHDVGGQHGQDRVDGHEHQREEDPPQIGAQRTLEARNVHRRHLYAGEDEYDRSQVGERLGRTAREWQEIAHREVAQVTVAVDPRLDGRGNTEHQQGRDRECRCHG